jgi:hypothetical protein
MFFGQADEWDNTFYDTFYLKTEVNFLHLLYFRHARMMYQHIIWLIYYNYVLITINHPKGKIKKQK